MRTLRQFLSLICIILLATPLVAAADGPDILSLSADGTTGVPDVKLLAENSGGMTLELAIPSVELTDTRMGDQVFQALDLTGGGHLGAVGQPALPTFTRLVMLPSGSGVSVRVVDQETTDLGTLRLAPNLDIESADKVGPTRFDTALYTAAPASEIGATVGEPALMHGLRVVPVRE